MVKRRIGFIVICFILSGCAGTHYVTDVEHRAHHEKINYIIFAY